MITAASVAITAASVALACALALPIGCSAEQAAKTSSPDAGHDAGHDARADAADGTTSDAGDAADAIADALPDDATTTMPADTGEPDYGTAPAPGTHVEATIGPAGGVLAGLDGTPLAHVSLAVPAGALATPTLLAIDLDALSTVSALPSGAKALSPFVRVGPNATAFSVAARLSLPCATFPAASSIGALARVSASWSALLEPAFDPATQVLTVSIARGAGAVAVSLPDAPTPALTDFAPATAAAGDVIFVDGSGFGLAPAWLADAAGGAPKVSQILVAGVAATALGWSDGALSFRVPAGASTGAITVRTPLAQATSAAALTVP